MQTKIIVQNLKFGGCANTFSKNLSTTGNARYGGEEVENASAFTLYPNPAKNNIQIQNFNFTSGEIRIFNVLGKQVLHQTKNLDKNIDVSLLNAGIYIVKISSEGKSKTQKLVIQ
jgi:hypothetical protein